MFKILYQSSSNLASVNPKLAVFYKNGENLGEIGNVEENNMLLSNSV